MRSASLVTVLAGAGLLLAGTASAEPGDALIGVWTGTVTVQDGSQDKSPGSSSKVTLSIQRQGSYLMADSASLPGQCTPLEKSSGNAWVSHCGRVDITYEVRDDGKLNYDEADYSAHHSYEIKGTLGRGRR